LLVFAAARIDDLSTAARAGLALCSVGLGAASYSLIENPIRRHPTLSSSTGKSLLLGGALLALCGFVVDASVGLAEPLTGSGLAAAPAFSTGAPVAAASAQSTETTVAVATIPPNDSPSGSRLPEILALREANYPALLAGLQVVEVPANLDPAIQNARENEPVVYTNGCHLVVAELQPRECVYGATDSSIDIVLFGDSHAAQWFPAIEQIANKRGWKLRVMTKSGCPTAAISQGNQGRDERCQTWRDNVVEWIQSNDPELVVMSARAYDYIRHDVWANALTDLIADIRPSVGQVLMLGDTPDQKVDVPACLAEHLGDVPACLTPRNDSINPYVMDAERTLAERHDVLTEPTTDWVCAMTGCPVVVGNILMYRDDNHLTTNAVLLLQPYLDVTLSRAMDNALAR
jgi:SGNH domain (fused to AT3 domains)